jgi:hypothetical protein
LFVWFLLLSNLLLFSPTAFSIMLPFIALIFAFLPDETAFLDEAARRVDPGKCCPVPCDLGINYLTTGMAEITPFRTFGDLRIRTG